MPQPLKPAEILLDGEYFHGHALTDEQKEIFRAGVLRGIGAMQHAMGDGAAERSLADDLTDWAFADLRAARILPPTHPKAQVEGLWDTQFRAYVLYEVEKARALLYPDSQDHEAIEIQCLDGDRWRPMMNLPLADGEAARHAVNFYVRHRGTPTPSFCQGLARTGGLSAISLADAFWAKRYGLKIES